MFEKEAEEYVINTGVEKDNDFVVYKIKFGERTWELVVEPKEALSCSDWIKMYEGSEEACHKFVDWQKGAEFGYNKANEWHYVKDELPDEGTYLVVWQNDKGYKEILIMNYEEDDEEELHWVDGDCEVQDEYIIAWKELPGFPKESE